MISGGLCLDLQKSRQAAQARIGNAGEFQAGCGIDEVVGATTVGAMRPERNEVATGAAANKPSSKPTAH